MKSCCKDILDNQEEEAPVARPRSLRTWLKRFGLAGFLFFLVKGLLWLAFGSALAAHFVGCHQ